jgi:amidase
MKVNGKKITHPGFDKHLVDGLTNGLASMFKKQFYRLPAVLWRLKRSSQDYARAMADYDAVLTPVLGHTTPALGHLSPTVPFETLFERLTRYVSFTPLANATGAPAISMPMGHTNDNLPVSVQLMGRYGGERTLLQLAFALEAEYSPWAFLNTSEKAPQAGEIAGVAP